MAFGAIKKFPNDTKPRVGIGVDLPFSEGGVFTPNYTTQEAIKYNLINFFLTNPGERPGNPTFGGGLRGFIFEQISEQNLSYLKEGEESRRYLKDYIVLNDSLIQQERQLKNKFAKIRYETDKKEKENEELKVENEKTQAEAEAQKQRATIGLLLSGISIMFLLSSISFFRFRRKKLLFLAQLQKVEAREEERRQIAKSLHDEVAGDLRLLYRKLEKSQLVEEAQKLELVKDNVRNLSHQLSSVSFEEVPFRDQILNLVSDYFSPQFIIKVNGLKEIDWSEANKSIKRMLYLSLRECIQNCQKYADASKMTISFSINKKTVFLDVVDNGKGFDTTTQKKGIGLLNLQERVQELNGTLTIESEVGKGTHIIIQTPLNA